MLKEANKVLDPRMQLCAKAQKLDYSKRAQFPEAPYKIQSSLTLNFFFSFSEEKWISLQILHTLHTQCR